MLYLYKNVLVVCFTYKYNSWSKIGWRKNILSFFLWPIRWITHTLKSKTPSHMRYRLGAASRTSRRKNTSASWHWKMTGQEIHLPSYIFTFLRGLEAKGLRIDQKLALRRHVGYPKAAGPKCCWYTDLKFKCPLYVFREVRWSDLKCPLILFLGVNIKVNALYPVDCIDFS